MDNTFSVAIHILIMISESQEEISSQALASSVGTNASYIRRVVTQLRKAGLIHSRQGKRGYRLTKNPKQISLLEIYQATQGRQEVQLFQLHPNINQECPVGQYMEQATAPVFSDMERELQQQLSNKTLEEIIEQLYRAAQRERN